MKKKSYKILSLIITLIVSIAIFTDLKQYKAVSEDISKNDLQYSNSDTDLTAEEAESFMRSQQDAMNNYHKVLSIIKQDDYCGAYIDENNKINVLLKEHSILDVSKKVREDGLEVNLIPAKYSKEQLENIIDILSAKMQQLDIYAMWLNEKNNCVTIEIDKAKSKLKAAKNRVNNELGKIEGLKDFEDMLEFVEVTAYRIEL